MFSFLTIPQIFKEEQILSAVKNADRSNSTNQTSYLNATMSPLNVTGNHSRSGASTASFQCTVPVYDSSKKGPEDHIVDFITGQVSIFFRSLKRGI